MDLLPTHTIQCNNGCVPSPDYFSHIYGIVPRDGEQKVTELFRSIPEDKLLDLIASRNEASSEDDGGFTIVLVLSFCMIVTVIVALGVFWYKDDIATFIGYKDGNEMLSIFGIPPSDSKDDPLTQLEKQLNLPDLSKTLKDLGL